jgi:hypothetical protein
MGMFQSASHIMRGHEELIRGGDLRHRRIAREANPKCPLCARLLSTIYTQFDIDNDA